MIEKQRKISILNDVLVGAGWQYPQLTYQV